MEEIEGDPEEEFLMYKECKEESKETNMMQGTEELELLVNAMTEGGHNGTIGIKGRIKNKEVLILVDIGSNCSFVVAAL